MADVIMFGLAGLLGLVVFGGIAYQVYGVIRAFRKLK